MTLLLGFLQGYKNVLTRFALMQNYAVLSIKKLNESITETQRIS